MAINKMLEIDLTQLTQESAKNLVNQFDDIIQETTKAKKQAQMTIPKAKKEETLKKIFGKKTFSTLVSVGTNPLGFVGGLLKTGIPGFGAAVAATAIIASVLKKFNDLEKKFTDDIRTRLNQERDTEQTARIQAGLAQEIYTSGPGITDPRDAYNTFDEFNNNQQRIETDYAIRTTSGVE